MARKKEDRELCLALTNKGKRCSYFKPCRHHPINKVTNEVVDESEKCIFRFESMKRCYSNKIDGCDYCEIHKYVSVDSDGIKHFVDKANKEFEPFTIVTSVDDVEFDFKLNHQQQWAVDLVLKSRKNVFLTGEAGTGKTATLNRMIAGLKKKGLGIAITASTGIAAININGQTLHSYAGVKYNTNMENIDKKITHKMKAGFIGLDCLIIDEISMLSKTVFELVDYISKVSRENNELFGGIQLIICGDFKQLPPVRESPCYKSKLWVPSKITECELTIVHRQQDGILLDLLRSIRNLEEGGTISKRVYDTAKAFSRPISKIETMLTAKRPKLDIPEDARTFKAVDSGGSQNLEKLAIVPKIIGLKIGMKVIVIKNLYKKNYCVMNGETGNVVGFSESKNPDDESCPIIRIKRKKTLKNHSYITEHDFVIEREQFVYSEDVDWTLSDLINKDKSVKKNTLYRRQIPLIPADKISIHRSQGLSLDNIHVDLSNVFYISHAYTALSRATSDTGLQIEGFNKFLKKFKIKVQGLTI